MLSAMQRNRPPRVPFGQGRERVPGGAFLKWLEAGELSGAAALTADEQPGAPGTHPVRARHHRSEGEQA